MAHRPLAAIRTRAAESRAPWTRCWTPKGVDLLAAVRAGFVKGGGQRSAVILSLLGAALTAAPAFAIDLSNGADFGGTYSCIGPGVASLPDVDVDMSAHSAPGSKSNLALPSGRRSWTMPCPPRPGHRSIRKRSLRSLPIPTSMLVEPRSVSKAPSSLSFASP